MVKAFMLYFDTSAYLDHISGVVISDNWEQAIKLLIKNNAKEMFENFEYWIFDNVEMKLRLNDDSIEFLIDSNEYRTYFDEFCTLKFGEIKYTWSYLEFKHLINELKFFLVYEKNAGDDPFCSWILCFNQIEVDPLTSQCMEIVMDEESGDKTYNIIQTNQRILNPEDGIFYRSFKYIN